MKKEAVQKGKIPPCRIGYLISVSNRDTNKSRVPNTFWTPSFSYYPIYPFMIPRLLLRTNMIISSLSLEAGISASILSIASELLRPD